MSEVRSNNGTAPLSCAYCGDPIYPGEPTGSSDGEIMHIDCAAKDMDDVFWDNDMGAS